ncbi:helix-turn-helix domain-containing protein [Bacillus sp. B1-b2]|uniref:helix-turn-helix domain-containing protein n=1 Tax=Bacillus sp. B1-b2 TaxID=2653201 RepID=UPI001D0325B0|nr:helix-turn-helix domain-containing protein [Bacillus sp. B1-b2]
MNMGERIKNARKEKGLRQSDLSGPNLSHAMISLIERGLANPSINTVKYISSKLDVDINYILFGETKGNIEEKVETINDNHISTLKSLIKLGRFKDAQELIHQVNTSNVNYIYKGVMHNMQSDIFLAQGEFTSSINELEKALIYVPLTEIDEIITIYSKIATNYLLINEFHKSIENAFYSILLLKNNTATTNTLLQLKLYYNLAYCYSRINEFTKGLEIIDEMLKLMKETNVIYKQETIYMLKGIAHLNLFQYEEGIKATSYAINLLEVSSEYKDELVGCYTNLGILYREINEYELSKESFKKGLSVNLENKDSNWYEFNIEYENSITHILNKEFRKAETICEEQLKKNDIKSSFFLKFTLLIALVHLQTEKLNTARNYIEDVIVEARDREDKYILPKAYLVKARVLFAEGAYQDGINLLYKSIKFYKSTDNKTYDSLYFLA